MLALSFAVAALGAWTVFRGRPHSKPDLFVPRPRGQLTFTKDIAPLMFQHCAGCHRPGEAAPFSLLNYQEVKKHAADIASVTARRYMPPWLPDSAPGEFLGDRRLSADQIGVIQQWAAEGAAEYLLRQNPNDPEAHLDLGLMFIGENRPAEAEPHFRRAAQATFRSKMAIAVSLSSQARATRWTWVRSAA